MKKNEAGRPELAPWCQYCLSYEATHRVFVSHRDWDNPDRVVKTEKTFCSECIHTVESVLGMFGYNLNGENVRIEVLRENENG